MRQFDVYGVGNALVDIEYKVSVDQLQTLNIDKGVMTLVDEAQQARIVAALGAQEKNRGSGGSAANTITAVSQLGGRAFYSCRVANDEMGRFYVADLARAGVSTNIDPTNKVGGVTGKCLVLVTPDADRTMNTFLGVSADVSPSDVDLSVISQSTYVYVEGYLVTSESGLATALYARKQAGACGVGIAVSLSDPTIVTHFRAAVDKLLSDQVDLLFANEDEAKCLAQTDDLQRALDHLKPLSRQFVVTRGAHGAVAYDGQALHEIAPVPARAIDTVGAGDIFAGAFLYGITHDMNHHQAGTLAAHAASKLIASMGPRLKADEMREILQRFQDNK